MPHARRVIFVQQLQQDLGILAVGLLPADSLGANPHHQSIGHMRQGTPSVDSHCPPDPEHRIVPNAPKRSVERQEELLAVSASSCSRIRRIRYWLVTMERLSFAQKVKDLKTVAVEVINVLNS